MLFKYTGFSSEIGTKLRDWAVGQAGGSCYSQAGLSSDDSKTLYRDYFSTCELHVKAYLKTPNMVRVIFGDGPLKCLLNCIPERGPSGTTE